MPNHTDDKSLFAECLQAEATYGTLLPCEQFAPQPRHELVAGAVCLSAEQSAARPGQPRHSGGNR